MYINYIISTIIIENWYCGTYNTMDARRFKKPI
jgi:hypothetical protein